WGQLAIEQHNSLGEKPKVAHNAVIVARAYHQKSKFTSALQYYLQALKAYQNQNDKESLYQVYIEVGHLFTDWDVHEKALEYFLNAREIENTVASNKDKLNIFNYIGNSYLELMDYDNALVYYGELLEIFKKEDNKKAILAILIKISDIHSLLNQHTKALEYELEILQVSEQLGDSVSTSTSLNNIGYLYKYLDEYELALKYFKESLELNKKLRGNNDNDVILLNIGVIYRSLGDKKNALRYLLESLQLRVEQGSKLKRAEVYTEISNTYESIGEYSKAIAFSETALYIAESVYNNEVLLLNYKTLSELYQKNGDNKNALKYYMYYASAKDNLFEKQRKHQQELLQKQVEIEKKEKDLKLLLVDKEVKDLELNELKLLSEKKEADIALLLREKELQNISLKVQQSEKVKTEQELLFSKQKLESEKKDKEIQLLQKDKRIQNLALSQKELEEKEGQKTIELLQRDKDIKQLELNKARSLRTLILIVSGILMVLLFLLLRSYHLKRKAYKVLARQNLEIQDQRDEIEQSYNNVKLLSEIAKEITAELSIDKIIDTAYKHVSEFMDATNFGVGIYNRKLNKLEFPQAKDAGATIADLSYSLDEADHLAVLCFASQQEIFIGDYQNQHIAFSKKLPIPKSGEHAVSIIYQPLVVKNKAIGVITVQSYQKNVYTDYHRYILGNMAVHIAIALENAGTYQEIAEKTRKLEVAFTDLQAAQSKLVQSEKMASLGLLTAGIAHEINNPINFVYAGVDGLKLSLEGLMEILDKYGEIDRMGDIKETINVLNEVKELKKKVYFDETKDSVFQVVNAIREGASRTAEIVNGLRNFSRLDENELKVANLHTGIDSTLLLLNNKIKKDGIKVAKDYDHDIPKITCYPGQLNQVFMNILSNAIEAIQGKGVITITTRNLGDHVQIKIKDNGRGMSDEIQEKIFDPFYSTKEMGKGTGLGLSISFGIIEKHKGKIEVISQEGKGSEFVISLPLKVAELAPVA
ncbi:MAG: tetratricopeptide repeat protein, partial [Bacteroidetes bacterium]|nr:tetratricopeptide repeat protein [Bacteroidota bacterium]